MFCGSIFAVAPYFAAGWWISGGAPAISQQRKVDSAHFEFQAMLPGVANYLERRPSRSS